MRLNELFEHDLKTIPKHQDLSLVMKEMTQLKESFYQTDKKSEQYFQLILRINKILYFTNQEYDESALNELNIIMANSRDQSLIAEAKSVYFDLFMRLINLNYNL